MKKKEKKQKIKESVTGLNMKHGIYQKRTGNTEGLLREG